MKRKQVKHKPDAIRQQWLDAAIERTFVAATHLMRAQRRDDAYFHKLCEEDLKVVAFNLIQAAHDVQGALDVKFPFVSDAR